MPFWSRSRAASVPDPALASVDDDHALVAEAKADPAVFTCLYERYVGRVYGYCYVHLGNRELAEDATSDVFLKALVGLHGYRNGSFVAWLFRIAHNVVIDTYRHRRTDAPIESADTVLDNAPTPEDVALADDERSNLHSALATLRDEQRAVLELQLAGLSGAQIASALGRSEAAIKMLRYRAIERLRKLVREEDFTEVLHG